MSEQLLRNGLESLRSGFQADGADLRLIGWTGAVAEVELVFGPEVCIDCILPKDMLELIITQTLQDHVPELEQVKVIDPRDKA